MAIQRLLIQYLLNPLARVTSRIPQKLKDAGFVCSFLWVILLYMGCGAQWLSFRYVIVFALGCLGLGGMILFSLPDSLKPVRFRKMLLLPWLGIGGLMLLSGVMFNVEYLPEALLFLVAYPIIFLIWNQSDSSKIFGLLLRGVELSFWLYALICLLFFPIMTARYAGLFANINGSAAYLSLVAVCLLIDCLWFEKITAKRIRKLIAWGICAALLLYTGSRTGILELAGTAAVAVVIGLIRIRKARKIHFFRNIVLLAVSALLFFSTTTYVFQFGYRAKEATVDFVESVFETTPEDPSDPDDPADPDDDPLIRPGDSADMIGDRMDSDGKDLNSFSSGRLKIWIGYLKQLNLLGHPDGGTVTLSSDYTELVYHTAHMTVLQIAYENGVIAAVLYLLFNLIAGIYSLLHALRHKDDPYAMIPLLISVAYIVYSLLASTNISFLYLAALLYYLVQFPLMAKPQKEAESQEEMVNT